MKRFCARATLRRTFIKYRKGQTTLIKPTTRTVINKLIMEIASDAPSNWGGWQGGQPGSGTPLRGMRGGKDDTGRPNRKSQTIKQTSAGGWKGLFKLDGKRTSVIVNPTLKQSENDLDVKNPLTAPSDNPRNPGKPARQVKEDAFGSLAHSAGRFLAKKLFGGGKKKTSPKIAAANKTIKPPAEPKPLKPPTAARQKQADLDASNAKFDAWKTKKADMSRVFKAAHAAGIGSDINPMRVRLDRQARAANPLKQPAGPPQTPAAPTSKPRVRIQAGSRIKENEAAPTNISSGIAFFSPLLGTTTKKRRKKRK